MSKTEKFLQYIQESKSKSTFKQYRLSINLFTSYYNETHETNLTSDDLMAMRKADFLSENFDQQRRFHREIEKFHKWMIDGSTTRKPYAINSARNMTLGIIQFFKYYGCETNVSFPMVITTKDFVPTIQQYRDMFNVADLRGRVILSMGLDLGWRISDFLKIEKGSLPNLNQEPPIRIEAITQKCNIIAKSFLSGESVELLKTYLPTLKPNNRYLFQSNSHKPLDPETVGDILKGLAQKAKIIIPKGKRLRFHCFRKRFLSTCADLKIDVNTAKLLVGKDVESSMLTYLSEVSHRQAFIEIKSVLTLMNGRKTVIEVKDLEIEKLKKRIEELESYIKIMTALNNEQLIKQAVDQFKNQGFKETFVFGDKENRYFTHATDKNKSFKVKRDDAKAMLTKLAELEQQKQKEDYQKLLENGNGNNNH
jgi:site-specific recombinase XerD